MMCRSSSTASSAARIGDTISMPAQSRCCWRTERFERLRQASRPMPRSAIGIAFASIDVVRVDGEWRVLEINSGVMMEALAKLHPELVQATYDAALDRVFGRLEAKCLVRILLPLLGGWCSAKTSPQRDRGEQVKPLIIRAGGIVHRLERFLQLQGDRHVQAFAGRQPRGEPFVVERERDRDWSRACGRCARPRPSSCGSPLRNMMP